MNRTPRLSKSGIEYLNYVWNFYSGCYNWKNGICPVGKNCWAKKITERFPGHYPNGFEPTFYPEAFLSPLHLNKPSIIGCAFMGDLFLDEIDPDLRVCVPQTGLFHFLDGYPIREIFKTIKDCPQHKFLFLTKCPWNLIKWSPFPENCWVGVTVTSAYMLYKALEFLKDIDATKVYLSLEPFLEEIKIPAPAIFNDYAINWLIIGACTGTKVGMSELVRKYPNLTLMSYGNRWILPPKLEWVLEIVEAADKAGIPVFLKDNLKPLLTLEGFNKNAFWRDKRDIRGFEDLHFELRQEMPKEVER